MRTKFRRPISVEHRVAVAVYHLASGENCKIVANLFGVSIASVCLIIRDVTRAIATNLLPDVIKVQEGPRLEEVINGFEQRWGFPQGTGAIDRTHIPVTPLHCTKIGTAKGKDGAP